MQAGVVDRVGREVIRGPVGQAAHRVAGPADQAAVDRAPRLAMGTGAHVDVVADDGHAAVGGGQVPGQGHPAVARGGGQPGGRARVQDPGLRFPHGGQDHGCGLPSAARRAAGWPCPASMAGQPASTAARHVPATVVSQRPQGAAVRARRVPRLSGDGSRIAPPGEADGHHEVSRRRGNLAAKKTRRIPCHGYISSRSATISVHSLNSRDPAGGGVAEPESARGRVVQCGRGQTGRFSPRPCAAADPGQDHRDVVFAAPGQRRDQGVADGFQVPVLAGQDRPHGQDALVEPAGPAFHQAVVYRARTAPGGSLIRSSP